MNSKHLKAAAQAPSRAPRRPAAISHAAVKTTATPKSPLAATALALDRARPSPAEQAARHRAIGDAARRTQRAVLALLLERLPAEAVTGAGGEAADESTAADARGEARADARAVRQQPVGATLNQGSEALREAAGAVAELLLAVAPALPEDHIGAMTHLLLLELARERCERGQQAALALAGHA